MPLLAKRLVEPTWCSKPQWVYTTGPAVGQLCADAGLIPDPEQQLILDATFGRDKNGRLAAFEVDIVAARQQLKTATIQMMEIGWIFVDPVPLILHTAHRSFAVNSAFRGLRKIITSTPALSKRLAPTRSHGITQGDDDKAIEFITEQRIQYATRTSDTGRSESVHRLVVDEAYAETEEQSGAILPTMGAVSDPQVVRASSGGRLKSAVLRDARNRGRGGTDPRQAYFEWGDPNAWTGCLREDCDHAKTTAGCALDDEDRWARIMPALDWRTPRENIRAFRQSMSWKEFAHELTVWWEDPPTGIDKQVFGANWADSALEDDTAPDTGAVGLALDVDRSWVSIAAAGSWGDGTVNLAAVDRRRGTGHVVAEAKRIQQTYGCLVVIDGGGPLADLIDDLRADGVDVTVAAASDVLDACGGVYDAVAQDQVTHMDHPELNAAVAGAVKRDVGDRFAWGRKKSLADVAMLEAATLAWWGVTSAPLPAVTVHSLADADLCDVCDEPIDRDVDDDDFRCQTCVDQGRKTRDG